MTLELKKYHVMKSTLFLISILSTLLLFSCNDDDNNNPEPPTAYQELGFVTGLDLFDVNGEAIGRYKDPNHKPGEVSVFPIPNNGVFSIFSLMQVDRLWLIPAECAIDTLNMDIFELSQSLTYEVAEIENAQIKDLNTASLGMQFQLDFSDVDAGYYRLFYQMTNEELFWQNMFIDPDANGFPDFTLLDNACN